MDEDGYFRIVDRLKEMIISGDTIFTQREIEQVFYRHPAVWKRQPSAFPIVSR